MILKYVRDDSAVLPDLRFIQEFRKDDTRLRAEIIAAKDRLSRVGIAHNAYLPARARFDAAKTDYEQSRKALANLHKTLGAAAFAAFQDGEILRQQEFSDRIGLEEHVATLTKEQEILNPCPDAGIVEKAKAKARQLAIAVRIKREQLSIGKLDARIGRGLIDSERENLVRSASTSAILQQIASAKAERAECKRELDLAAERLESAKAALSQAIGCAQIGGETAIPGQIRALENEAASTQSRLRTRERELFDMLVANASSFADTPIKTPLNRLAGLLAESRPTITGAGKAMTSDLGRPESSFDWHRYAAICAAGLICLLLLYWTARLVFWRTGAHDLEPLLGNTPLNEDEQQYVRESRSLRDQNIETWTKQLKREHDGQSSPSHDEQEKIQHMAERLVQHRDVCRPEFWAGQPLFVGFIAHLSGEYRIEQIIGEKDMICRLYGPAGLLEWSGLLRRARTLGRTSLLGITQCGFPVCRRKTTSTASE